MANTYTLLETITVGAAGASSVTFNSIPQTGYTDLIVKVSGRIDYAAIGDYFKIQFNGVTTAYTDRFLYGNGSAAASASGSLAESFVVGASATASTFGNAEIYIPNYTSANYKSFSVDAVNENNATSSLVGFFANLWSNTAAITSVTLTPEGSGSSKFLQYSTFSLYGVSALGTTPTKAPKATGGSIIQTDGTYWYHAFLSSGTFTPATALSCDYLVVAGGGAGSGNLGSGAGAGGYRSAVGTSVSTAQTITVGAGGAPSVGAVGTNGSNSSVGAFAASGGAKGAYYGTIGYSGGSGGGGTSAGGGGPYYASGAGNSGSYSPVEGYAGGTPAGTTAGYFVQGGGGGAGGVGGNGTATVSGDGGIGSNAHSTWASVTGTGVSGYFAGGGGGSNTKSGGGSVGGTGGTGGGANGTANDVNGLAGTANTGGGASSGSGGGAGTIGGAGGSGIVIVRYLA